jgi:hypothetical protein
MATRTSKRPIPIIVNVSMVISLVQTLLLTIGIACMVYARFKYGQFQLNPSGPGYWVSDMTNQLFLVGLALGIINLFPLTWETVLAWKKRSVYKRMYFSWFLSIAAWIIFIVLAIMTPATSVGV